MKKIRQMIIFMMMCCMLLTMMSQSVTAQAVGDSAKAAVVIDAASGAVIYSSNAQQKLPMASTTKIMSALIALESGDLDKPFTVDSEAIKVEGSSMGLVEGDTVTMRALVCGMLLPSGNDAANAAAVRISGSVDAFVEKMNERAAQLGLENTHFVTPSGLDDDTDEHYSTALDMAKLTAAALENKDFADICSKKYIKLSFGDPPYERWLTNTNKLLDRCEGVIGVKTGFTDKAKRCLVSACERDGSVLICVTLNDPDDWNDHEKLYDYAFAQMQSCLMPESGRTFDISVQGGGESTVSAAADRAQVKLPADSLSHVTAKICIKPFVYAPIKRGEEVGFVDYYYDGKPICRASIRTLSAVERITPESGCAWEDLLSKMRRLCSDNKKNNAAAS